MVRARIFQTSLAFILLLSFSAAQEKTLPNLKLRDMQNQFHDLGELVEGKTTLINFWATYCVPCRKEMKHLNRISKTYAEENVMVIGVSIDDSRTVGRVKSIMKSQKLDYTILLDTDQRLYKNFNTSSMPFSILVNAQGQIVWEHTGYVPGDEVKMETEIIKALALSEKD